MTEQLSPQVIAAGRGRPRPPKNRKCACDFDAGGPVTDNYDPYDQDTWPPCEACGRRQVHRSGCPAITVTVGALAATTAALTIAAHAAMGVG